MSEEMPDYLEKGKYAVAKDNGMGFKFTKLHLKLEDAETEAARLCSETKEKFIVLEVVGRCEPAFAPVKWTERKGA